MRAAWKNKLKQKTKNKKHTYEGGVLLNQFTITAPPPPLPPLHRFVYLFHSSSHQALNWAPQLAVFESRCIWCTRRLHRSNPTLRGSKANLYHTLVVKLSGLFFPPLPHHHHHTCRFPFDSCILKPTRLYVSLSLCPQRLTTNVPILIVDADLSNTGDSLFLKKKKKKKGVGGIKMCGHTHGLSCGPGSEQETAKPHHWDKKQQKTNKTNDPAWRN